MGLRGGLGWKIPASLLVFLLRWQNLIEMGREPRLAKPGVRLHPRMCWFCPLASVFFDELDGVTTG